MCDRIYALDVTPGNSASEYGPDVSTTRKQIAAFLERIYNPLAS